MDWSTAIEDTSRTSESQGRTQDNLPSSTYYQHGVPYGLFPSETLMALKQQDMSNITTPRLASNEEPEVGQRYRAFQYTTPDLAQPTSFDLSSHSTGFSANNYVQNTPESRPHYLSIPGTDQGFESCANLQVSPNRMTRSQMPTIVTRFNDPDHPELATHIYPDDPFAIPEGGSDAMAILSSKWLQCATDPLPAAAEQTPFQLACKSTSLLQQPFEPRSASTRRTSVSSCVSGPMFSPFGTPISANNKYPYINTPVPQSITWAHYPTGYLPSSISPESSRHQAHRQDVAMAETKRPRYDQSSRIVQSRGWNRPGGSLSLPVRGKPKFGHSLSESNIASISKSSPRARSNDSRNKIKRVVHENRKAATAPARHQQQLRLPVFDQASLFATPDIQTSAAGCLPMPQTAQGPNPFDAATVYDSLRMSNSAAMNTTTLSDYHDHAAYETPGFSQHSSHLSFGFPSMLDMETYSRTESQGSGSENASHVSADAQLYKDEPDSSYTINTPAVIPTPATFSWAKSALQHPQPSQPPESDFCVSVYSNPMPQHPHFPGDIYTPTYRRRSANGSWEGWCGYCVPGRWLDLKNSRYWEDKLRNHGIAAKTKIGIFEPKHIRWVTSDGIVEVASEEATTTSETQLENSLSRVVEVEDDDDSDDTARQCGEVSDAIEAGRRREGWCGACEEWVGMDGMKNRGKGKKVGWWMHVYHCIIKGDKNEKAENSKKKIKAAAKEDSYMEQDLIESNQSCSQSCCHTNDYDYNQAPAQTQTQTQTQTQHSIQTQDPTYHDHKYDQELTCQNITAEAYHYNDGNFMEEQ